MNKLLVSLFAAAALLAGCTSNPISDQGPSAQVETRGGDTTVAKVTPESVDGSGLPRELTDPKSVLSRRSIYFDLDKYDVKDEYKDLVAAHAKFLNANRGFKVLLQGNTDERGSSEYNLSLGQKRADAVKKSLTLLGVKEEQVESVSLGKEKPSCTDSTEDCWAKNRRADILYKGPTGKGEF
ncbi:MAG: peptidoglycan-associated lipoprotein Pal [Azonexus sp.]|nr:peptidoglycan-associated lipoprotein Pal [Betaproteobacteria bacterium]MBK8919471.1 peptidoglycan-associated lipoprotein Pal [Betaproteobacteria bacterium]MBP6037429.1 peptidoglycan-associated lipoprotein Pal [Azonexus sp.]MBP6907930.1 peptidoglycan-associated lipoprotein Pal [Azonexus sp.]